MASITFKAKHGPVTIELKPGEDSVTASKRMRKAVAAAGGQPAPTPPAPPSEEVQARHRFMRSMGLLECARCLHWVVASPLAAGRHTDRCSG